MDVAKGRLTQTFKFLKELNELRNPVPREISGHAKLLWLNEWPTHPFIEVRRGDRKEKDDGDDEAELEPLIRIRRADLGITKEGVVVTCKKCTKVERVGTDTLQHLVDRLAATCFSCTSGKLKSMAKSFGNILICQNPECGRNNTWQGLSERIRR